MTEQATRERQALDEARPHDPSAQEAALLLAHEVDHGENIGGREAKQELLEDTLGSGVGFKPFVHDCDPQIGRQPPLRPGLRAVDFTLRLELHRRLRGDETH